MVVPYNRVMINDFDCHINVELAAAFVTLLMHLYGYNYKEPDFKDTTILKDEIAQQIRGRYLSATEAVWRIFGYEITRRNPSVTSYPVHLQGENYVVCDGV